MIPPFALHQPRSVEEALEVATEREDSAYLAGGTELTIIMKMGLSSFADLIDLKAIQELRGIDIREGFVRIGSAVTHLELERSPLLWEVMPGLVRLERTIANVRVRASGTLGGSLCFGEPHSDPAPYLIAAEAQLELETPDGHLRRPVDGFLLGPMLIDKAAADLVTAIWVPLLPGQTVVVHRKVVRVERPAATIAVRLGVTDGIFRDTRIVVGSVGDVPALIPEAAAVIDSAPASRSGIAFAEAAQIAAERCDPYEDINGPSDLKRRFVRVLVERALDEAFHRVSI